MSIFCSEALFNMLQKKVVPKFEVEKKGREVYIRLLVP